MSAESPEKKEKRQLEERTLIREIINFFSLTGFIYGPLDERLNIREGFEKQLEKSVPHYRTWAENNLLGCLGGLSFILFLVLLVSGIFLLMYYRPTTGEAYKSVVEITNLVSMGWLVRGVHFWAGNLMVITVTLHLLKVFVTGAYRPPRDFNWVTGVILFLFTLLFAFSGYLLPWNQISYWATTVGTETFGTVPFIGESLKFFIRGGPDISQITLTRFFALHVVILPLISFLFLLLHFAMIRRQGISDPL